MKLYDYFRSSAAYRVRIALNIKGLDYEKQAVHLVKEGGEQKKPAYLKINPQGRVPSLMIGDQVLTQSMAILEYLEECYPAPALLPSVPIERAKVRAIANIIACDIHPLNNLSVLQYLQNHFYVDEMAKKQWYGHWIHEGFSAIEAELRQSAGQYCFADQITFADICLVPQVYNAYRFELAIKEFPTIIKIYENCLKQSAVIAASPEQTGE